MPRYLVAAALIAAAGPAFAQPAGDAALPDPNDRSDMVTLALGAAALPDYEGSNDNELSPFAAIIARVNGIGVTTRGTYLYVDFVPRPSGAGIDLDAGPIVGFRRERTGHVKDDFVDALPERNTAIEVGGFVGVTAHGLTNPYDSLSLRMDVIHDVGKAHKSTVFAPAIEFGTPLSQTFYIGTSLSAEFVSNKYADYYFSISPADSIASLLPVYNADGGMKNWKLSLLANQSITGNLTHGLSVFAGGTFSRLLGDIADSPIVDLRGRRSQFQAAVGLAYTW